MINVYSDKECKNLVDTIEWDNDFAITLVNGTKETLEHTVEAGDVAVATLYLRNEDKHRFGITKITLPDKRLKYELEKVWLDPDLPVKMTVKFDVPINPTPDDMIKSGKIKVEGYYVYVG